MSLFVVRDNLDLTYSVIGKISDPIKPIGDDLHLVDGPDISLRYARADLVNDEIVVSKDQSLEDNENNQLTGAKQAFQAIRNIDWPDTNTVAKLKAVVRNQNKVLLRIARMLRDQ